MIRYCKINKKLFFIEWGDYTQERVDLFHVDSIPKGFKCPKLKKIKGFLGRIVIHKEGASRNKWYMKHFRKEFVDRIRTESFSVRSTTNPGYYTDGGKIGLFYH